MAKAIMVQGTMSNSGKSFVAAGLCRIFRDAGYSVAPFKSQNMALNSFITREGLEMGRAQVMQAEAAGIEPSVLMNPILLKPTSDKGSQVIVKGEVLGTMGAWDYYEYKNKLRGVVEESYAELASQYDVIVIEGAGSPAEINLRDGDFVNMGMAKIARAPVLLVGDIDRGGVFASVYGTIKLLEPDEQSMFKGVIINKFRGDPDILRPGLGTLEKLTGVPVLGVVPMLDLDLDDEDSLAQRMEKPSGEGLVDVAVIRLPHISNFTDFNVLSRIEGVSVRYVRGADRLGAPDMVILPGTKNTMGDLKWLKESGMEGAIKALAAQGVSVAGVCGGYQMLGVKLRDPDGVEEGGELSGLGLLPAETDFLDDKVRTRVTGEVLPQVGEWAMLSGTKFEGYEIHMGRTSLLPGAAPFAKLSNGREDGAVCGGVFGSYVHGLMDGALAAEVAKLLLKKAGCAPGKVEVPDDAEYKRGQYGLLADGLRGALDMKALYRILEEGLG